MYVTIFGMRRGAIPLTFFKEVRSELEKVSWPSRQESVRLTTIVVFVSILVGLFIGFFDFIFTKLLQIFLIS